LASGPISGPDDQGSITPLSSPCANIFIGRMKKGDGSLAEGQTEAAGQCPVSTPHLRWRNLPISLATPHNQPLLGTNQNGQLERTAASGEKPKALPTVDGRQPPQERSRCLLPSCTLRQQLGAVVDGAGASHREAYTLAQFHDRAHQSFQLHRPARFKILQH